MTKSWRDHSGTKAKLTKIAPHPPLLKRGEASHIILVMSSYAIFPHVPGHLAPSSVWQTTVSGQPPREPDSDKPQFPEDDDLQASVVVRPKPKTRKPSMYKVLMLNDDYTPMEFVVHVLERFFSKTRDEATTVMLHVHQRGVGVCGVFTYEVAESKVTQVMDLARQNQHPLQCTIEKD